MPSLSELPDKIKNKKIAKALKSFGFSISTKGGKGSHIKATCERTQKSITIPRKMNKNVLYYLVKEIEKISETTWEDIKKKL